VGAVRHPNIIEIHDIFTLEDGLPALVMDLLEGESLADRLDRTGALAWEELVRLMIPVLSGVGAAHVAGVVHRDLKPDNIFLARLGDGRVEPVVFDFGICKLNPSESLVGNTSAITAAGFMMGTPAYMAPEQVYAETDVDARADVWALGVIMYECATGKRPIDGESLGQMIKLVTAGPIVPLGQMAPHLPAQFSSLIDRMLTRDRDERPRDLREPFNVLRSLLPPHGAGGSSWLPPSIPPPAAVATHSPPRTSRALSASGIASPVISSVRPAVPRAPTPRAIVAAVLSLTAIGFVAGLVLLRARRAPDATGSSPPPARAASTFLDTAVVVNAPSAEPSSLPAASTTPAASVSVAPKRKRAPAVVNGFQGFNTGRK
ncbi:MAG TPA: protein kinase, partial [Polyangiaceae bacterium]